MCVCVGGGGGGGGERRESQGKPCTDACINLTECQTVNTDISSPSIMEGTQKNAVST